MDMARVIEGYLALRTQKEGMAKRHKEEAAPINEKIERLEAYLMKHLTEQGTTSLACKGIGTAFLETKTDASVQDWDATLAWIVENKQWAMLERRVSKTVVKDFVESQGSPPPGVSITRETVVRVRKG